MEELLKKFKVNVTNYVIHEENLPNIVMVGGIEVIRKYPVRELVGQQKEFKKIDIHGSGDKRILLPFKYTDVKLSPKHLEKLLELKTTKTLSKEEASKYKVVSKDKLLNKVVYAYGANPSTNSIALAEQFQIRHDHVMQQIFKLAEQNPSVLMGIKYGVYRFDNTVPNDTKVKVQESVGSTEKQSSKDKTKVPNYRTFLYISEDVYYDFINSLGTPKSQEMVVYRSVKRREYLKGFQRLREVLISRDVKEEELEWLIKFRTEKTKELMDVIKDYVLHYNENSGGLKQLNLTDVSRLVFNVINGVVGINSVDFKYGGKNREFEESKLQNELATIEGRLIVAFNMGKVSKTHVRDLIPIGLDVSTIEIEDYLRDRKVYELIKIFNY